jgi:bifunctional non-homologous end joining protein LigD
MKASSSATLTTTTPQKNVQGYDLKIGRNTLHLTNQSKLYWPDDGITKGELVKYYHDIAPVLLPYLRNRPQSLHRFPNGISGASFFQKDIDIQSVPRWLKTKAIYSESNEDHVNYLLCNDASTLIYMANLGCIEINPWNSRIGKLDYPDWMVLDLDPGKIAFQEVVKVARVAKELLDRLELLAFVKTSGATGLHIYVPLEAHYDYHTVRTFAHLIATLVHEKLPDTTSLVRSPAKRTKKIYLDYLQNSKGQTIAAPYSVRPRPGATVSTPLSWSEVTNKLDPTKFTIKNIFKRLDKKGDLWEPVIGKGQNMMRALKNLQDD